MSQAELLAVFVDGETKTGKGAAGEAIAEALKQDGHKVYYDVAGDFYRRYVGMVRRELQLDETTPLPIGPELTETATRLYKSGQAFDLDESLGDLQRPAINDSVSLLGEEAIAQQAGADWYAQSIARAHEQGAEILVLDGRNPRHRVTDELPGLTIAVRTALDLYLTCEPHEAARRVLVGRGDLEPTEAAKQPIKDQIDNRRSRDRTRVDRPFLPPAESVAFVPGEHAVDMILKEAWDEERFTRLPATITLDNTHILKPEMLSAVSELAVGAIAFIRSNT